MTLTEVAQQLKDTGKKVQLIYAFNGVGKTRLSREFKELIAPKSEEREETEEHHAKIIYYNAFTEDLFYWDNDLEGDSERKMKIQPNAYTQWVLQEQGKDQSAIEHFQHYTNEKLMPNFNEDFSEVSFSYGRGNKERIDNIKISKGEESNFIWSIFYSLIEQVVDVLNVVEPEDRETDQFDQLEYVFIDDPVSSLDENNLIRLAVDLVEIIKLSDSEVRFIITTHNPLFFNVLCNEFRSNDKKFIGNRRINWKGKWFEKSRLEKKEDGTYELIPQPNDSPFSYHLHLMDMLQNAVKSGQVEKYHFNFLRNIFEKTATFLGYKRWEDLLLKVDPYQTEIDPDRPNPYLNRILNFSSHSKHSAEEISEPSPQDKAMLKFLMDQLVKECSFKQQEVRND